jgi:hypothetical protein
MAVAGLALGLALGSVAASPARAEWREARSRHFAVYSEGKEAELRETATRLEQLDALMRMLSGNATAEADQIANPLTVYVVDDIAAVRRLYGKGGGVGGFYVPRATGSIAFTPRYTSDSDFTGQLVLFHEYAHHYLLGNYAAPYPAWFAEGYAEFMSTVRFTATTVDFGRPAQHRAWALGSDNAMTVERLFTLGPRRLSDTDTAQMYARGWLLTHYIMFDPARGKQFGAYVQKVASGVPTREAAIAGFGDLGKLNGALNGYLSRNRFAVRQMTRDRLAAAPVAIRTLTPGQGAMIPLRMRSTRGVDRTTAVPLFAQATRVAAAYPTDPVVQGWLAEMAYDAGDDAAAEGAATRALAADPRSIQALLYTARVHLRRLVLAKDHNPAAWKEARSWIVRANRIDANDPGTLGLFYQSFAMADAEPGKSAVMGLYRASELAPQDPSLRWQAARQHLIDGDTDAARTALRPLAYDPHAAPDNPAARLLALLDAGAKGRDALGRIDRGGAPDKTAD